ncbi:MAG TPA: hypothetical protein DCG28_05650 [Lachnospiraceae bacterium]|nr:hypothetical protein [Lachnospiraceae bacterium]
METKQKRKKNGYIFILLITGIVIAVTVNIAYFRYRNKESLKLSMLTYVNERSERLENKFNVDYLFIDSLCYTVTGNIESIKANNDQKNVKELKRLFEGYREKIKAEYCDVIFEDGEAVFSPVPYPQFTKTDVFIEGFEGKKKTGIVNDEYGASKIVTVSPCFDDDGEVICLVVFAIDSKTISEYIRSDNSDSVFITDDKGRYLMGGVPVSFDFSKNTGLAEQFSKAVFKGLDYQTFTHDIEIGNNGFTAFTMNFNDYYISYTGVKPLNWMVFYCRSAESVKKDALTEDRFTDIITAGFILLYALLLIFYYYIENKKDIKILEEELEKQQNMAMLDELTGIATRRTFVEQTRELLFTNTSVHYMMVVLDIEKFKAINDKYGHFEGDRLLCYLTTGIRNYIGKVSGAATRLFADYFALCVPYSLSDVENLVNYMNRHISHCGMPFDVYIAYGIYEIKDREEPVDSMIEKASLAEKAVKEKYLQRYELYSPKMGKELLYEQQLIGDMKTALQNKEFEIYVQPQYDYNADRIGSGEILVRWHKSVKNPDGSTGVEEISPGIFIPLFEKNGFVTKLDKYIWEEGFKLVGEMILESKRTVPLSINISRADFEDENILEFLLELRERYEVPKDLIRLEITESAYINDGGRIIEKVKEFVDAGFVVEIDDFGSGYSSLNALRDMPASVLKTDLKFLYGYSENSSGSTILKHVMLMAEELGMSVVAEGVETKEQADFLHTLNCNIMQGFYYSKPIPADLFVDLVQQKVKLPLKK